MAGSRCPCGRLVDELDPAVPCAMGIYLKTGDDSYAAYGISGGP